MKTSYALWPAISANIKGWRLSVTELIYPEAIYFHLRLDNLKAFFLVVFYFFFFSIVTEKTAELEEDKDST